MMESAERIQFIAEYLSSYQTKIEALNKNGLFDSATLFEVFACETCAIWFGQKFSNLNTNTSNFPYVDLVSEDGLIYVQVSTAQDIPAKVKTTLTKIKDKKSNKISNVRTLFFFVLGNQSIDHLPDYSGKNAIGSIEFKKDEHLITVEKIIARAKVELSFQKSMFNLLYDEYENIAVCQRKLSEQVALSKELIDKNIDCRINNEYEINRDDIIAQIKQCGSHYIMVQGEAGSGKSAICKKITESESIVLYARAERFLETGSLDEIWGISVPTVLRHLGEKRVIFFIDALEFIADGYASKLEILQSLFVATKEYMNAFIISSCRTSDSNAFIRLISNYKIDVYTVPELTDSQILQVAQKYTQIAPMYSSHVYSPLLNSPFYLNLIVSQVESINEIKDINSLREFIWNNTICLKNKTHLRCKSVDIQSTVNQIVFSRATQFVTGVSTDGIDDSILSLLSSEGVIIVQNGKVRLKYDIFEDICFEHFFDEKFDECKGNYAIFFADIEKLGRCVYRRYQIWIENKLFVKSNRDKFIYQLISLTDDNRKWRDQTIIGIVKSRYCSEIFIEHKRYILQNRLQDFLSIINLFSFESRIVDLDLSRMYTMLTPIGLGRSCLINIIYDDKKYFDQSYKNDIYRICSDYARYAEKDSDTAVKACSILSCYVEEMMNEVRQFGSVDSKIIISYLHPIYFMADYYSPWLKTFWGELLKLGKTSTGKRLKRFVEDVAVDALKNTTPALASCLADDVIALAKFYWFDACDNGLENTLYDIPDTTFLGSRDYGFSKNAEHYSIDFETVNNVIYFQMLLQYSFHTALSWAIELTNHAANSYKEKRPDNVCVVNLLCDDGQVKEYLGRPDFWMAGLKEHYIHDIVGDVIYLLTQHIFKCIKLDVIDQSAKRRFCNTIKNTILTESNNVIMLSVIERIGQSFFSMLPGYNVELASSIEIILWDIGRVAHMRQNPLLKELEGQILKTVGIPFLTERYNNEHLEIRCLQDDMMQYQLFGDDEVRQKALRSIDYLYSIIPNSEDNAPFHLQIQKMDSRNADMKAIDANIIEVSPQISGAAKQYMEAHHEDDLEKTKGELGKILTECANIMEKRVLTKSECLTYIDKLSKMTAKQEFAFIVEKPLVMFIAYAFQKVELSLDERSSFCVFWVNGIKKLFSNGSFSFDVRLVNILFSQLNEEINHEATNAIKLLMLDCLLYKGQHGIIQDISKKEKEFLLSSPAMANALFNTIVALSKDRMAHYLYNATYALSKVQEKYNYRPNIDSPPLWIDNHISENGDPVYPSRESEIVSTYLLSEEPLIISSCDINQYDIECLCYCSNCGLRLEDNDFREVINMLIKGIIQLMIFSERSYRTNEILDTFAQHEVIEFLRRELLSSTDVSSLISVLFSEQDYVSFTSEVLEFYEEIVCGTLPAFFDAYSNADARDRIMNNISEVEKAIKAVPIESTRTQLYRCLYLSFGKHYRTDWNELKTCYSYRDKMFLCRLWSSYGSHHLDSLLYLVYQLHIGDLLPEVIIPLNDCFTQVNHDKRRTSGIIRDNERIINFIITKAFSDFADSIKQDEQITQAYEHLLEILLENGFQEAAVILDEFRIH